MTYLHMWTKRTSFAGCLCLSFWTAGDLFQHLIRFTQEDYIFHLSWEHRHEMSVNFTHFMVNKVDVQLLSVFLSVGL